MSDSENNVFDRDSASLVFPAVQATAVYTNDYGDVVIRQQSMDGDRDDCVFVPKYLIERLVEALRTEAAE